MTGLRILHLDIARGSYLRPAVFARAMHLAAQAGFTHVAPYLEHMLRLPAMEAACPPCAYTPAQWRAFEREAVRAGVELIPHFNVIGHSARICAAYPELAGAPGERELDAATPVVRRWTARGLTEACACSRGRYLLVGGDEWQAPRHRLADPAYEPARAWADQLNAACRVLKRHGRVPIVWHDMLLHYPAALERLSREAVVAYWFYDEDVDYAALRLFKERGFRTIMATGSVDGLLSGRRARAIAAAVRNAERHGADGIMVTSWERNRWERLRACIPLAGRLLREGLQPDPVVEAASVLECLEKLPPDNAMARRGQRHLRTLLRSGALRHEPLLARHLDRLLRGDRAGEKDSFRRYHLPTGPQWETLAAPHACVPVTPIPTPGRVATGRGFGLTVTRDPQAGAALRFRNGAETFVVYPTFGASLQDWRLGAVSLLAHPMPAFLASSPPPPGGYRSYTRAGGFRPIWALGSHTNPCMLWQHPFRWRVLNVGRHAVAVALTCRLPHVAVRYVITIRRGVPGFRFRAIGVNRLARVPVAWNFNLPLRPSARHPERTRFEWEDGGRPRTRCIADAFDSFFILPPARRLRVHLGAAAVTVTTTAEDITGFHTDWSTSFVTPDVHGRYRMVGVGERIAAEWEFKAVRSPS
ncbi:MAG: family 20 glycosylhydrolase [Lentisphaerae bacterium]|nr:family 20 glycosylhydrolase [Lentisphaerota bacterium]